MRRATLGTLSIVGSLLASTSMYAADLPARVAPPVPVFVASDWSGFYFGANVGTIVDPAADTTIASNNFGFPGLNGVPGGQVGAGNGGVGGLTGNAVGTIKGRDFLVGAHGGYNWQAGAVVFGLEGDVSGLGPVNDFLISGRARIGYATPQFLVYGTGGVAYQNITSATVGTFVGGNGGNGGGGGNGVGVGGDGGGGGNGFGFQPITRAASDKVGFVGGGGIETKLAPQVSAGVEALYYVFDNTPLDTGLPRDFLTVRGRLTFHFDQQPGPSAIISKDAPAPLAINWTGGYAGGHVGGLFNLNDTAIDQFALANGQNGTAGGPGVTGGGVFGGGGGGGGGGGAVAFANTTRDTSVIGGLHLGYNWQAGKLVFGGEADASFGEADAYRYMGSVRGRLGVTNQSFLYYGTGGVAFNRDESAQAVFAGSGGNGGNGTNGVQGAAGIGGAGGLGGQALSFKSTDTRVGFVVGGGLESKISERWVAGAEGLYYNFGRQNAPAGLAAAGPGRFFTTGNTADAFVLRARLSYSFSGL